MADKIIDKISFSSPGIYRIEVLGKIGQDLRENFEIETEQVKVDEKGKVITSLKIHVRDQAELSGLICTLYNWQLVLISVQIDGQTEETETP